MRSVKYRRSLAKLQNRRVDLNQLACLFDAGRGAGRLFVGLFFFIEELMTVKLSYGLVFGGFVG